MKNMTESEFLSFLYAEKERLHTNFSKPGWNNWVIGGAFIALLIYLFNIITTTTTQNLVLNYEAVLMLFISLLCGAIIVIMVYPLLLPKMEIYYTNRISTLRDESPIFELVLSGLSFLIITTLLIINRNYSWMLYVFGFASFIRLSGVCIILCNRNKLVSSGAKYNFIPTNWKGLVWIIIYLVLYLSIAIYSSWSYFREFHLYLNEVQIAAVLLGFWVLIYIFFKTNSITNKMLNGIDSIIDRYVYSGISQQDAMEELMYLRYGGNVYQIINNDLSLFFKALNRLEYINAQLDITIKTIDEGKLNPQFYYEWLIYRKNEQPKLIDAISKGEKIIKKLDNINNIPNNVKHSDDFKSLITLTESGLNKIRATKDKFKIISERFAMFRETYYCRKSNSFCDNLECKKRNDKMSIKYALKTFPLKYVLYLIVFRLR